MARADRDNTMSALAAAENPLQLVRTPRVALRYVSGRIEETPTAFEEMHAWELNSELVLVCPELRLRSLELLPECDPELSHDRFPRPILLPSAAAEHDQVTGRVVVAVLGYTLQRVWDITRLGFTIVGVLFTIAVLAELLAR
jgi:hypothetical protein